MQTSNRKIKDQPGWLTALSAFLLAAIVTASLARQNANPVKYFAEIMQDGAGQDG
jgi:hypothetical protein